MNFGSFRIFEQLRKSSGPVNDGRGGWGQLVNLHLSILTVAPVDVCRAFTQQIVLHNEESRAGRTWMRMVYTKSCILDATALITLLANNIPSIDTFRSWMGAGLSAPASQLQFSELFLLASKIRIEQSGAFTK